MISFLTLIVHWERKKKSGTNRWKYGQMDKRVDGWTNRATMSLIELLIAAKNAKLKNK
jgi:hypothetical protein